MDYKSVLEEQIRELQKVQDETSKIEVVDVKAAEMRKNAETISGLIQTIRQYGL